MNASDDDDAIRTGDVVAIRGRSSSTPSRDVRPSPTPSHLKNEVKITYIR